MTMWFKTFKKRRVTRVALTDAPSVAEVLAQLRSDGIPLWTQAHEVLVEWQGYRVNTSRLNVSLDIDASLAVDVMPSIETAEIAKTHATRVLPIGVTAYHTIVLLLENGPVLGRTQVGNVEVLADSWEDLVSVDQ